MNLNHEEQIPRLNKIQGQIKGITNMIQNKRYCMDILIQIKSALKALSKVRDNVLKEHLNHCVKHAMLSNDENSANEKINELIHFLDKVC